MFWRPQVALFVNETTLLPVLVPLAAASTVMDRFRPAHRSPDRELAAFLAERHA